MLPKRKQHWILMDQLLAPLICLHKKLLRFVDIKKAKPFIYLLYDFKNTILSGNKRKIQLKLPFNQIEGHCYHRRNLLLFDQ